MSSPRSLTRLVAPMTGPVDANSALARTLRHYGIFAGAAYLVFLPFLLPAMAQARAVSASWWTPTAITIVVVPGLIVGLYGALSWDPTWLRRWARVGTLGILVAVALWWVAWNGTHLDDATVFWLGPFVVLGSICAMIAWPPTVAAVYLLAIAVAIRLTGNVAQSFSGTATMLTDAACSAAFAVVPLALGISGLRTAAELDRTEATAIALAEDTAATTARSAERTVARALTHDEIMASLLEADRNPDSAHLPRRAASALEALDSTVRATNAGLDPDAARVATTIADAARHNDPGIDVTTAVRAHDSSTYPVNAVAALVGATAEATRNCYRHVPADRPRRCHISVTDHRVTITVSDEGGGFDPAATPRERLGIAVSIRERMRRVSGGDAVITSRPGAGTTVTVSWRATDIPAAVNTTDLLGIRSTPSRRLGALVVAVMAASAVATPGAVAWWVPVVVIAALAASTALLVTGDSDRPPTLPTLIVAATPAFMCGVYLFSLDDGTQTIPLWVTGPPALVVSILGMRRRPYAAVIGFLAALVVVGAWSFVREGSALPGILLIGPSGGFVAISIVFARVNRTLARNLIDARSRATHAAADAAAAQAAAHERELQLTPVTALARPLLLRLADGDRVDHATRTQCRLTEARLRDLLRARGLCTPDVDEAVVDARRRGVAVTLLDDRGLDGNDTDRPPPLDDATRRVIVDALDTARAGTVRIRTLPPARSMAVTVVTEDDDRCEWIDIDRAGHVRSMVTEMAARHPR
ncbi:ATP-binding protein [Gordonia sp. VNK1]|uniref:sensor histidine kinase n=1 Tax=Gordonia oleivorans TaxID=3156618 RepID=UPI0032B32DEF